ncbi:FAD:protein FMN transferase [Prevotella sp. E13-27]|uniref:FAD:protein FMN transferase n=1 Tax=Prevotella sp. E13-27 TaxID=2938122 RepID=UPI00200A8E7E|nr:FAD:protein FMN transferase [Prevotella sp. E13-27]MCK8622832.1 FAD:protein FMN transferase [Prevotella sp. E13-27]
MFRLTYKHIAFLLFLIAGTIYIAYQQHSMPYQKDSGFIFGTVYNISYQSDKSLKAEIEAEMKRVDAEFSMFNDSSTVSRFNRGERPRLSKMFLEVYKLAFAVNKETEGAFDITVAPLVNAWGFGFKSKIMPDGRQVDSLRAMVGMKKLTLVENDSILTKPDVRMMLDFSAIAKGYGSDCVARLLREHGVKNFMVEIGGEVVTQGISPKRLPWRIGVTKPIEDSLQTSQELQTVLNVTDRAMATSGNYRNFYYQGGRKYAHTIDPRTGYPVQHSLLSSTVLADNCAVADAYATAFMVLGFEKTKEILERHKELMAYLIYTDNDGNYDVWFSPSLKDKINE